MYVKRIRIYTNLVLLLSLFYALSYDIKKVSVCFFIFFILFGEKKGFKLIYFMKARKRRRIFSFTMEKRA